MKSSPLRIFGRQDNGPDSLKAQLDRRLRAVEPASKRGKRNPVIVIPGVLGSKLVAADSSRSVWGEWRPGFTDPASGEGAQLFGLPMEIGKLPNQLESRSRVEGMLGQVRGSIAGMPVRVTAYGDVLSAMGVASYAETHAGQRDPAAHNREVAFEFSYDWRRSLDECAIEFEAFVLRATRFLQVQRGTSEPIRFDVVAHSMGGLVLRYFLQFGGQLLPYDGSAPRLTWAGAAHVEKAVIAGTPNAGSLKMVDRLVQGIPGNPLHPTYGPVLVGTFPSGYQMLPRARHRPVAELKRGAIADPLDPDFWLSRDWGLAASWLDAERARQLPGIDNRQARLDIAEDHLRKCLFNARLFQAAMDQPLTELPPHLGFHLFVGQGQNTPCRFAGERGDRSPRFTRFAAGDGTVLARSAYMRESGNEGPIPWRSVTPVKSSHMDMLKDPKLLLGILDLLGTATIVRAR